MSFLGFQTEKRTNDEDQQKRDTKGNRRANRPVLSGDTNCCHLDDPESILNGVGNILKKILVKPKEPFRVVGRIIPNVGFEEAISVQLYLEKIFHSVFDDLNGSVICTYDFSQIKLNNNWRDWLEKLESYHHGSIIRSNHRDVIKINYKDLN